MNISKAWTFNINYDNQSDLERKADGIMDREDYQSLVMAKGKIREVYVLRGWISFWQEQEEDWVVNQLQTTDAIPTKDDDESKENFTNTVKPFSFALTTVTVLKRSNKPRVPDRELIFMEDDDVCLNCGA